ncbi:hypothetical protein ACLOJK_009420 [Asimina triloba]
MQMAVEDTSDIDKLYEYGERLSEAKEKSLHVGDYEGIIQAARGSMKAKQLAAQLIPRFFKFFPSLASRAYDAHCDLCEEEELGVSRRLLVTAVAACEERQESNHLEGKNLLRLTMTPSLAILKLYVVGCYFLPVFQVLVKKCILIRVQAIRGLPLLCKDTPDYVSKIVDVLGQLLLAEENVERDAVHKALMSLLRQDPKASLTTLFHHVEAGEEKIREKVLNFIKDKVFPIKAEILKPQEQMERHVTDLVKKSLQDVTGAEFKMFMDFLMSLSIFGPNAPPERIQELVEIIEGQADLHASLNDVSINDDGDEVFGDLALIILCNLTLVLGIHTPQSTITFSFETDRKPWVG